MNRRTLLSSLFATPLLLIVPVSSRGEGVRRRLKFARGTSSARVDGAVIRGERDVYILGAREGQTMRVRITSVEENAAFQVARADDGAFLDGAGELDDATSWEGRLPVTGDYQVIVGPTRGNATYSLVVSID